MSIQGAEHSDELDGYLSCRFSDAVGVLSFTRGSTGLFSLFSALRDKLGPGDVIIPGICCETVALAAIYAGMHPVIADVDPENLCLSPKSVAELVGSMTRAIVVVHAFGCVAPIDEILSLCKSRPIVLIEDLAHAAGGCDKDGKELGKSLDCSLLSFSEGKVIKGSGGSLIFNRNPSLYHQVRETRATLPPPPPGIVSTLLEQSLRNLTHGLFDLVRAKPKAMISHIFGDAINAYKELIAVADRGFPLSRIADAFDHLAETTTERYRRYRMYLDGIRRPGARVASIPPGGTCWRCPVLFSSAHEAQAITHALRSAGVHASNHYFPLDRLMFDQASRGNLLVGDTIVNLWVDDLTTDEMILTAISVVNYYPNEIKD